MIKSKQWLCNALSVLMLSLTFSVFSAQLNAHDFTLTKITDKVYSAIGATAAPSYENSGHNNNLTVIITDKGVVIVNGSDNYLLAQTLHQHIKKITSQPIKFVINENGQGHAFLGNSYWIKQGAEIIAQKNAIEVIKAHGHQSLKSMKQRNKEKSQHTTITLPTLSFDTNYTITLGNTQIELIKFGEAHAPGDISVYLPKEKILIAGDIAFHQRMLGVHTDSNVLEWITSYKKMQQLDVDIVIPGHGSQTTMAVINKYTLGYLTFLRDEITDIIDSDGDLTDAYQLNQSQWQHLDVFDELAAKNAGRVFQQLEMEMF